MKRTLIAALLILIFVPGCSKSQIGDLAAWAARRAVVFAVHCLVDLVVDDDSSQEPAREAPPRFPAESSGQPERDDQPRNPSSKPDSCTGEQEE
jgi:hypothetical protein